MFYRIYLSFSHCAFINKRLKERKRPKSKNISSKDNVVADNLRTGDKLHEILKKSFESEKRNDADNDEDEEVEEYFSEDDECIKS